MLTVILCLNIASFVLALVMLRQEWRRLSRSPPRENVPRWWHDCARDAAFGGREPGKVAP